MKKFIVIAFLCLFLISCVKVNQKGTYWIPDYEIKNYVSSNYPIDDYSFFKLKYISVDDIPYELGEKNGKRYFKIKFNAERDFFRHNEEQNEITVLSPYFEIYEESSDNVNYVRNVLSNLDSLFLACKLEDSIETPNGNAFISNIFDYMLGYFFVNDRFETRFQRKYLVDFCGMDSITERNISMGHGYCFVDESSSISVFEEKLERAYGLIIGEIEPDLTNYYEWLKKTKRGCHRIK